MLDKKMREKWKRAVLLLGCMVLVFSGCGKTGDVKESGAVESQTAAEQAEEVTETTEVSETIFQIPENYSVVITVKINPELRIYLDENVMRMCKSYRMVLFGKLAATLIHEGKNDKALQVLDKCMEVLPPENVPLDYSALSIGEYYYTLGQKEKGHNILKAIGDDSMRNLNWYFRLNPKQFASVADDLNTNLYVLQEIINITKDKDPELMNQYKEEFDNFRMALSSLQPKE